MLLPFWLSKTSAMRSIVVAIRLRRLTGRRQTCSKTFSTWQTEKARVAAHGLAEALGAVAGAPARCPSRREALRARPFQ